MKHKDISHKYVMQQTRMIHGRWKTGKQDSKKTGKQETRKQENKKTRAWG